MSLPGGEREELQTDNRGLKVAGQSGLQEAQEPELSGGTLRRTCVVKMKRQPECSAQTHLPLLQAELPPFLKTLGSLVSLNKLYSLPGMCSFSLPMLTPAQRTLIHLSKPSSATKSSKKVFLSIISTLGQIFLSSCLCGQVTMSPALPERSERSVCSM
jgi:hypothetical protein